MKQTNARLTLLTFLLIGGLTVLFVQKPAQAENKNSYTAKDGPLSFCGDGGGWPPYTYLERKNGIKTEKVVGIEVDIVREILDEQGIKSIFETPPWKRCLLEARHNNRYQIVMSSSYSDDRARHFLYSESHYTLHHYFFYDKNRFPNGLDIKKARDLIKHGDICGIHGYNYEGTGVLLNSEINQGAKNYQGLIKKIMSGHCIAFIGRLKIVQGFANIGEPLLTSPRIGYMPVPDAKPDKFYFLISRQHPKAVAIEKLLSQGIRKLKLNGRLDAISQKYQDMAIQER